MKVYNFKYVSMDIDERQDFFESLATKWNYNRVYTKKQKSAIKKIADGFNVYFEGWKDHKSSGAPDYESLLIHNQDKEDDSDFCLEIQFLDIESILVVYNCDSYSRDIIFDNYEEFIEFLPKLINDFHPI